MRTTNYLLGHKNLKIVQESDWFKFSIDSILLSYFVQIKKNTAKILDIGTGNAIIPILLSTKTPVPILGIEIQKDVYELGRQSIIKNKLENQVKILCEDIKTYVKEQESDVYDIITCNPPYFKKEEKSHLNVDIHKQYARHEILLDLEHVMISARKLLRNNGSLYLVHRSERIVSIIEEARKYNLEPKRIQFVYPKKGKNSNIVLIEFVKNGKEGIKLLEPLYIYDESGNYTEKVQKML